MHQVTLMTSFEKGIEMKKFYCNGKEDFCDRDSVHDCDLCEHFNGDGGEEREVDQLECFETLPGEIVVDDPVTGFENADLTDAETGEGTWTRHKFNLGDILPSLVIFSEFIVDEF